MLNDLWWMSRRRPPLVCFHFSNPETLFYFTGRQFGQSCSDCTRVFDWGYTFR